MAAAARLRFIADSLRPQPGQTPQQPQAVAPTGTAARAEALALSRPEPSRDTADHPWELLTSSPGWQARDSQGEVAFDGKLWLLGGWFESFSTPPRDVWSSEDGVGWAQSTSVAGWRHSDFPMTVVFQDKIFVMGGWTNGRLPDHSASNEVWCSCDGAQWQQLTDGAGWTPRLAAGIAVFQDSKTTRNPPLLVIIGTFPRQIARVYCKQSCGSWSALLLHISRRF